MIWRSVLLIPAIMMLLWGTTALYYQLQVEGGLRWVVMVLWPCSVGFLLWGWWRYASLWQLCTAVALFVLVLLWWLNIKPSHDREWAADVAQLTTADITGTQVVLHNVRNFNWITKEEAQISWETRHYDIDEIQSVEMFLSYWMGPAIAHTLVSFGFSNGEQVVWSVEIRREAQESFSAIGGFFKQFELSVVAADENDIIRLRTNHRGEDVYRYPIQMPLANARSLFLAYANKANQVAQHPRFYHTLTANCTTIVYELIARIIPDIPKDYRLLLSGYLPEYVYELGALDRSKPLSQLRANAAITKKAKHIPDDAAYSQFIRQPH